MIASGRILDDTDGQPIPGASVTVLTSTRQVTGAGASANGNGQFTLSVNPTDILLFSATSYHQIEISASNFSGVISLERKETTGDPVIVVGTRKTNYTPYLVGGAALLLLLSENKKKKSVSGIYDYYKDIHPLAKTALFVGAAYVAYTLIFPDPDKKDQNQAVQAATVRLAELAAQGIKPKISNAQAQTYADIIFSAVDDCGTDEQAIYGVLGNIFNEADLQLIIQKYGVRPVKACFDGKYFGTTPRNLPVSLQKDMSRSDLNIINQILNVQLGINYKF